MTLWSARFRGNQILQDCADGDTSQYLRFGSSGEAVRLVQEALIDLGYSIPSGPTGNFLNETSAAVVAYKTDEQLFPQDPVAGQGTISHLDQRWAVPFADREEFLSWQARLIPEWNFTRDNDLARRTAGDPFTFRSESSWLPQVFRDAVVTGFEALLDPFGSPLGPMTSSATWGASPLDLYHCHVVGLPAPPSTMWLSRRNQLRGVENRLEALAKQADQAVSPATHGSQAWTDAFAKLLLAPAPTGARSALDDAAAALNACVAETASSPQLTLLLLWHTFEQPLWRPSGMNTDDPRRSWWNVVAPKASGVSPAPFPPSTFTKATFDLFGIDFVVDRNGAIVAMPHNVDQLAAAAVGVPPARIEAAEKGLPFP